MNEFQFIASLLAPLAGKGALGLKDDAALLALPAGNALAVTKDALAQGVHFIGDEEPGLIARKALRVNLSDLAAMGARPHGYFLALLLPPSTSDGWLRSFAEGLRQDQAAYGLALLGGDTTRTTGPLAVTVTALGLCPEESALRRSGARPGDGIYVSGTLGDAALGLRVARAGEAEPAHLLARYRLPEPQIALGQALRGIATACMDISDGLLQDLGHLCAASGVGAEIRWQQLPLSPEARRMLAAQPDPYATVLAGGDDYELLFTVPPGQRAAIGDLAARLGLALTLIGEVTESGEVRALDAQSRPIRLALTGFRHF